MLLVQRIAVTVAWVGGVAVGLAAIDWLLRLPGTVRLVLLVAGLGVLAYASWTYLRPALRFRPGLTELALRAERLFPAVAGRLASSVEFALSGIAGTNPLAARSVVDTERRLSGESLGRLMSPSRTWRDAVICLAVLSLIAGIAWADPAAAQTGLARLLAPYGSAQWPARTGVESLMREVVPDIGVHPRGQALPLRAMVTKGQPDHVSARYRLQIDGRFGPWTSIVLTDQGNGVHERLVDTTAEAIELYFETQDARTEREHITLAAPPAVRRAVLTTTPPSYAAEWFQPLQADLGPGLDDRAVTDTPSLIGSAVKLVLELNKPIPAPQDPAGLARILGWEGGEPPSCTVDPHQGNLWTLSWRLAQTRSLSLTLTDEYGLRNTEPIGYQVLAVEDRLPTVTIMQPESDEPVLASAVIPLVTEARDDVAVSSLGVEAIRQVVDVHDAAPNWQRSQWFHTPTATLVEELDLAALDPAEGEVILLRGVAEDVFELDGLRHPEVRSPPRRLRVISEMDMAQRLRRELGAVRQNAIRIEARQAELEDDVIAGGPQPGVERAQAQIGERIAAQREAVRGIVDRIALNRLDDQQLANLIAQSGDLLDYAGRAANKATEAVEQRQRQMTETPAGGRGQARPGAGAEARSGRAAPGGDADQAEAPRDRPAPDHADQEPRGRNDVDGQDPDLRAGELEDDLGLREPAEEDRPVVEAQREVRQELADLITLLDRDEDTWVATRRLEELMDSQTAMQAETAEVERRTLGRTWDELTAGEQSELERMAEQQSDLAEQARQLIEDLRRRAGDLQEADQQAASAMRTAAESGEQRELSRDMDRAAQRVQQNQMRNARNSQQAARQTMQDMLKEIRDTTRASAQELLRRLASLIESIDRLVLVQTGELDALARVIDMGDFSGRDRSMIRLNQNTQAVATEARTAGQEARRIARVLDRAADAQGAAVIALRAFPVQGADAQAAEDRSLQLLREAADLARELEQTVEERELMRQRGEVIAAYRELAERETALRTSTIELAEQGELDRRRLIEARGLGRNQEEIRTGLDELRAATRELQESVAFSQVHGMIDGWARRVAEALSDGELSEDVTDRQQRIADSIGRLIEAIEGLIVPPGEFAQSRGGGGQSGQQGQMPLIPPIAELMLLRGMQEQIYQETTDVDGRIGLEPAGRLERLNELGRQQRELLEVGEQMAEALRQPEPPMPGDVPQIPPPPDQQP